MSRDPAAPDQPSSGQPQVVYVERRGNGLAVAGFVLAIVGAAVGLIPLLAIFALICGILGLVFSAIGWRAVSRDPQRGRKGLAIAGTIIGILAIVLAFIGIAILDDAADDLERDLEELERELEGVNSLGVAMMAIRAIAPGLRILLYS